MMTPIVRETTMPCSWMVRSFAVNASPLRNFSGTLYMPVSVRPGYPACWRLWWASSCSVRLRMSACYASLASESGYGSKQ